LTTLHFAALYCQMMP